MTVFGLHASNRDYPGCRKGMGGRYAKIDGQNRATNVASTSRFCVTLQKAGSRNKS